MRKQAAELACDNMLDIQVPAVVSEAAVTLPLCCEVDFESIYTCSLQTLGAVADDMHVKPLYKALFHIPTAPSLAFVGLPWKSVRFLQFEIQVNLLKHLSSH